VGIGALLVAVLLFSAWQHFELVQHGYLMARLQRELAAETEANRQLKLLIATLRAPQRIETVATGKLNMVEPAPADVVIIERVATPAPPAKSIVAAR
jgi:cell division protein FtsL